MAALLQRNPFRYGDLALDESFTDRRAELDELKQDMRNGQNVVVFAPRRFGKSSLVWRATQELVAADELLVAQVDLMAAPTKEKLAEKLAKTIHDDIASPALRARERAAALFNGLRVRPVMTLDPDDGSLSFSFQASHRSEDIDATIERLLELPAQLAAERKRRVALVFDEFQEVQGIDPRLPALMRSIFQLQPDVAHVYLGSKRTLMERLFNDVNEPFWRSAKKLELGPIPAELFVPFVEERFHATGRRVGEGIAQRVVAVTHGHPHGTQELSYFLWEETPRGGVAREAAFMAALAGVLRSEGAHFSRIWEKSAASHRLLLQALAHAPIRQITDELRARWGLPHDATVRKALAVLVEDELVARDAGGWRIAEPFLAEWIRLHRS